jgi:hypothetical protein
MMVWCLNFFGHFLEDKVEVFGKIKFFFSAGDNLKFRLIHVQFELITLSQSETILRSEFNHSTMSFISFILQDNTI